MKTFLISRQHLKKKPVEVEYKYSFLWNDILFIMHRALYLDTKTMPIFSTNSWTVSDYKTGSFVLNDVHKSWQTVKEMAVKKLNDAGIKRVIKAVEKYPEINK